MMECILYTHIAGRLDTRSFSPDTDKDNHIYTAEAFNFVP